MHYEQKQLEILETMENPKEEIKNYDDKVNINNDPNQHVWDNL